VRLNETFYLVFLLTLIGLGIFVYRVFVLDFPVRPDRSLQSWHVEAKLEFRAQNKPVRVEMYLPRSSANYAIVDETYISDNYGITTTLDEATGNRLATWSKRQARNKEIIYYRAVLYEAHSASTAAQKKPRIDVPAYDSEAYALMAAENTGYFAMKQVIEEIYQLSVDAETFTNTLFVRLKEQSPQLVQLKGQFPEIASDAGLAVWVLRHARIPARVISGISLPESGQNLRPEARTEVFYNGRWHLYDLKQGGVVNRGGWLGWWIGEGPLYKIDNASQPKLTLSAKRNMERTFSDAMWQNDEVSNAFYKFSILSLPVDVQLVFQVLLLVPIGALVVIFLRQFIGISTYGTFMPVLVALAFRETQLMWGIILFSSIVAVGLITRAYLDRLRLLMVPRLTAMLTVVVICIYLLSLLSFHLQWQAALSISLFPIVILTMLIERMSITWDESGAKETFMTGLGSLFTAIIGYMAMNHDAIAYLVVSFPELLLVVLAMAVAMGRYNGYKLTEYYRFRKLKGHV
jgi:hypothetical protein